ncbi:MAG: xylose isomerase [Saprospiraceae bacterium]|nr:xylose isomerase [Saprospiraceae bacterium]
MIMAGKKEFFQGIGKIPYEGKASRNPLAFKYYDKDKVVAGKSMADHFRFATAYWHSFCGNGSDPFGMATRPMPWLSSGDVMQRARDKADAAFEFMSKIGMSFYCFHDFDLVEEGDTIVESEQRLHEIASYLLEKQEETGIKPLWGTANLFSHPRYMNGAATNPDFAVVSHAGLQVKNALDVTIKLGGQHYVFWGGREGYMSLLNTDMKRELDHLAAFLHAAMDYGRSQGFTGWFFIEPKPMEPSKHQYDFDAATSLHFIQSYGLEADFKLNIEVNHATLAQHTFQHELQVAANAGALGSIDANRGDYQNGWDTDQFPNNVYEMTEAMMVLLKAGGLQGGGINFDAKLRRNSTDVEDLFYAHIGGMDVFARALLAAEAILNDSAYAALFTSRYASFDSGQGLLFEKGELGLTDLYALAKTGGEPAIRSGRQELIENIINQYL